MKNVFTTVSASNLEQAYEIQKYIIWQIIPTNKRQLKIKGSSRTVVPIKLTCFSVIISILKYTCGGKESYFCKVNLYLMFFFN